MAAPAFNVEMVPVKDVFIVGSRRDADAGAVQRLAESITALGLQTPITVRVVDNITDPDTGEVIDGYALVAGRHRLEAMKLLGVAHIPAIVRECDEVAAELWEIAENLHRADLSKEQRDEQIRRYAELLTKQKTGDAIRVGSLVDGRAAGPQHQLGVASQIAAETGVSKDTVRRALNPERVQAERARSKIDSDVKERAAREIAGIIAEHVPGEWWDAVKANLYAAGASNIANEFTNITGQSIMDRSAA